MHFIAQLHGFFVVSSNRFRIQNFLNSSLHTLTCTSIGLYGSGTWTCTCTCTMLYTWPISGNQTAMESIWPVSKLSSETVGSRRELVANSVHTADADATRLDCWVASESAVCNGLFVAMLHCSSRFSYNLVVGSQCIERRCFREIRCRRGQHPPIWPFTSQLDLRWLPARTS